MLHPATSTDLFAFEGETLWTLPGGYCQGIPHGRRLSSPAAALSEKFCCRFPLTRGDLTESRAWSERRRVRLHDLRLVHARLNRTPPACRAERLDGGRRAGEESITLRLPRPARDLSRTPSFIKLTVITVNGPAP